MLSATKHYRLYKNNTDTRWRINGIRLQEYVSKRNELLLIVWDTRIMLLAIQMKRIYNHYDLIILK